MSLLADLLSKVKHPQTKKDVPPNLKTIVQESSVKTGQKKKYIILSAIFCLAILSGLFLVYFVNTMEETSISKINISSNARQAGEKHLSAKTNAESEQDHEKAPAAAAPEDNSANRKHIAVHKTIQNIESKGVAVEKEDTLDTDKSTEKRVRPSLNAAGTGSQQPAVRQSSENTRFPVEVYLYRAGEYEKNNDYAKAIEAYLKVIERDRENYIALNNIGYIYLNMGLVEEAIQYYIRALAINGDYVPSLINLGIAHARTGNYNQAQNFLSRAATLAPENQSAALNLAILYEKQGAYKMSADYYSRLMSMNNQEGFLGLARIYEKEGLAEEALEVYTEAYESQITDPEKKAWTRQRIKMLINSIDKRKAGNTQPH